MTAYEYVRILSGLLLSVTLILLGIEAEFKYRQLQYPIGVSLTRIVGVLADVGTQVQYKVRTLRHPENRDPRASTRLHRDRPGSNLSCSIGDHRANALVHVQFMI